MTQVTPLPKAGPKVKAKKKRKKSARQIKIDKCDELCAKIIKSIGYCESGRPDDKHGGPLNWSHGHSRWYHAIRWDHRNSYSICRNCHAYYTRRDLEWKQWMRERLGDDEYEALWRLALTHVEPDLDETLTELRELWKQIEAA